MIDLEPMENDTEEIKWTDKKRWVLFALPWTFTRYSLTEDKLLIDSGLLVAKQEEILLYRILDITLTRNVFQRMSGLGTITIMAADKSTPAFEIKNIPNSKEVKNKLSDLVEAARDKKKIYSREIMGNMNVEEYV